MRRANILTSLVVFLAIVHEASAVVTVDTFCTLTKKCENGKACGENPDTGFLPLTEGTKHLFKKTNNGQIYAKCVIPAMPKNVSKSEPKAYYDYSYQYPPSYYRNNIEEPTNPTTPMPTTPTPKLVDNTVPTPHTFCTLTKQCENGKACGVNLDTGFRPLTEGTMHEFQKNEKDGPYAECVIPSMAKNIPTNKPKKYYGYYAAESQTTLPTRHTTTPTPNSTTPKKVDTLNEGILQAILCRDESSNCPAGTKCGMNYDTGFVPFNKYTAKSHPFLRYGPGKKLALCVVPAEVKHSIFEDVRIEVGQVDLNRKATKTLFEKTFREQSGASSLHYTYSRAERSLRSSSNNIVVDITLEYESKADAARNLDKINTELFRKELVSALQNQDPTVFGNVVVTPVKVTRLQREDTTENAKLPVALLANGGQKASVDEEEPASTPSWESSLIACGLILGAVAAIVVVAIVFKIRRGDQQTEDGCEGEERSESVHHAEQESSDSESESESDEAEHTNYPQSEQKEHPEAEQKEESSSESESGSEEADEEQPGAGNDATEDNDTQIEI